MTDSSGGGAKSDIEIGKRRLPPQIFVGRAPASRAARTLVYVGLTAAGLVSGCGSSLQSSSPDGQADGSDAPRIHGGPRVLDALGDVGEDTNGGDGGPAAVCDEIQQTYAAALTKAQECTLGAAGQCAITAAAGFFCSCTTVVNGDADTLAAIRDQFKAAGCVSFCGGTCIQRQGITCVADATSSTGARCREPTLLNLSASDDGGTFSVPAGYEVDILLQNIGPNGYGNEIRLSSDAATVIEVTIPATPANPGGPIHLYRLRALYPGEVVVEIPFVSATGDGGRDAYRVTLEITNGSTTGSGGAGGAAAGGAGGAAGRAAGGAGGADSGGHAGSGSGDCGGVTCAADQYCDWANDGCGDLSLGAICRPRPQACVLSYAPVCACDGHVYGNACEASSAGQDVSASGGCAPPTGLFACGPNFCRHGSEYCEAKVGGPVTNPGNHACHPLPAACGATPSCACLAGLAMCGACSVSAAGDSKTACLYP